ncbi:tRNA (adenosine(37)-N6)-threonylcarbamoyltransferase complex ATPase subunit type 1 TsaE [Desulfurobacterium sp.]
MILRVYVPSAKDTHRLGKIIGKVIPEGTVVLLYGDLGCGKTCITKGIAEGLGISPEEVSSPSFIIIQEYGDKLVHVDLYRLSSVEDLEPVGIEEYLFDGRVKVIEWPEIAEEILEGCPFEKLKIECHQENSGRIFTISGNEKILKEIEKLFGGENVQNS